MRYIKKITVDIEDPDTGQTLFTFAVQDTEIVLHGDTTEELDREMKAFRERLYKGVNIYFPKYEDKLHKSEVKHLKPQPNEPVHHHPVQPAAEPAQTV